VEIGKKYKLEKAIIFVTSNTKKAWQRIIHWMRRYTLVPELKRSEMPEGSQQTTIPYQSLSALTDFQSQISAHARICRIAANICSSVIEKRESRQSRWPT
jgi:hypothetical protein